MSNILTSTPERNIIEKIFLSPDERRLRAFWRLLLYTILLIGLLLTSGIVAFLLYILFKPGLDSEFTLIFSQCSSLLVITGITFLARKFIDRRSIVSLGLKLDRKGFWDVLAGISIAFFMMGSIYLAEISLGWSKFEGFSWQTENTTTIMGGVLVWLVVFLFVGWQEELLSRGYHLQNIADGLNLFWGVALSSSIFGILHVLNPGASWISTLGIMLAGAFLALPYLLTRQLWLSIGLHIGWNFFEGVVFGFPVSGMNTYRLLRHTVTGPELWTGGKFGPEAGLLLIPALALGVLLVYVYTHLLFRNTPPGSRPN